MQTKNSAVDNESFYLEKIIVFVGSVSDKIQKELAHFAKNYEAKYKNAELDSYFGKGFVATITDLYSPKKGGMHIGGADDTNLNLDDIGISTEDTPTNEDEISFGDIFTTENISTSSILDAIKSVDQSSKSDFITTDNLFDKKKEVKSVVYSGTPILEFIYQSIWSVETPMDLREKLWTYLGIPIFAQHLIVKDASGDNIPLYYNIYNNNKLLRMSLQEAISNPEKYSGVPILNHYYAYRDYFFIQTLDNFELLDKFVTIGTSSMLAIDLYDARDFLCNINLRDLKKDKNMEQLLYYGFFILFWPIFTEDSFHEYVVADGDLNELAKMYPELLPRKSDHKTANDKEYKLFNLFYTLTESGNSADKKALAEIEKHLYVRIAKNNILNFAFGDNKMAILSLRNLFDKIVLSDDIVAIKYSALYLDQRIELHKTYKTTRELSTIIPLNSILIRCVLSKTHSHDKQKHISQSILDISFFENGNYFVKCTWDESTSYTFDESIKVAADFVNKKIIAEINKLKGSVIHHSYDLPIICPGTVKFANISAEIFYRQNMDTRNLHLFRIVLADFYEAKIFTQDLSKQSDDEFNFTYFLWKGNHQQDRDLLHKKYLNIANTYEYLTKASISTKWSQIYVRNKSVNIQLRHTDLKFTLSGMWDKEFNIVYSYILLSLYILYSNEIQKNPKYNAAVTKGEKLKPHAKESRNIKSLKQIDPVLYDFKRYNSDLVYSKICQKPNQPTILTISEYKELPEKEKAKVIKYWNFTTHTDAYYYAPNPKYPFINFIVGKHPLNYCIPCSKKTSFEKKSNIKHKIYEACMKSHAYEHGHKNIITDTRYIMNYGKPIDAGRLCKLPENTLEPFFYEGFYEHAGYEEECYQMDKYFLVGIAQDWEGIPNMGILNIIGAALETSVAELIADIKKKIVATPTLFGTLLNGQILREFYDYKEFVDILTKIFITRTLVEDELLELDWMAIFIDILFYYFNIVVIEFVDKRGRGNATEGDGKLYNDSAESRKMTVASQMEELMPGDFVELKINQRINVISGDAGLQYNYLIILTKAKYVNPIYLVNPVVYFKTKVINKKIFKYTDPVVSIFSKFLTYAKQQTGSITEETVDELAQLTTLAQEAAPQINYTESYYTTIGAIDEFTQTKDGAKYSIGTYYVNAHNQCYYIELTSKSGNAIYLPVTLTHWSPRKDTKIEYKPYKHDGKMEIKIINKFLTEYNAWIVDHSGRNDAGIRIDKWIGKKNKVFGFMYGALNYYFDEVAESIALAIKQVPIWKIPYEIADINNQIYNNAPIKSDPLVTEIAAGFYNNHLYQLLLLEYSTLFTKEKNTEIRTKLKKIIMNSAKESLDILFENILNLLTDYYSEYIPKKGGTAGSNINIDAIESETYIYNGGAPPVRKNISAEEVAATESVEIWQRLKSEDYNRLLEIINAGITKFMDKAEIYRTVDQYVFNFDHTAINKFKTMPATEIKKELLRLSKKIVQIGAPPKTKDIPNLLVPCSTGTAYYCRGDKLIISEKRLDSLLDILVADIKNPMKEKWIFSSLFADNVINFLKFEYRPLETITVETL